MTRTIIAALALALTSLTIIPASAADADFSSDKAIAKFWMTQQALGK